MITIGNNNNNDNNDERQNLIPGFDAESTNNIFNNPAPNPDRNPRRYIFLELFGKISFIYFRLRIDFFG